MPKTVLQQTLDKLYALHEGLEITNKHCLYSYALLLLDC